ncbi:MAG: RimK-like protein [Pseudomonadota bacterium]
MSKFCLVLCSKYDFSVDLVIQELEEKGVDYIRLNKEELSDYLINIDPVKKVLTVKGHGMNREVSNITSVWFRQPVFIRNAPAHPLSLEEQLSRSQWAAFLRGIIVFEDAVWMNWPSSTYSAESKPYQLMLASKIGFMVPKTMIGNDSSYFEKIDEEIIIKSLDTVLLREGEDCLFAYTSNVTAKELNEENTRIAPLTVQEYVYPKTDIRVTVVGEKLHAVKITSAGRGIDNDWRLMKKEEIEYADISLPKAISKCCKNLVSEMGLKFGAIDLIESNGNYYFIEINPTGEWGWLSTEKRAIEKDIVNVLAG